MVDSANVFERATPVAQRHTPRKRTEWSASAWLVSLAYLFACPSIATAQEVILPPSQATVPSSDRTQIPFGRSTPVRTQIVYSASMFGAQAHTFSEIGLRIDEGQAANGKAVDLEIRASSLGRSVTLVQSNYAANRGADEVVVFDRQIYQLSSGGSSASPNPFDVVIPLDRSFTFDPGTGGALVLEFVVFAQPPGVFPLDSAFLCVSPQVSFGSPGCNRPGADPLLAESVTEQVMWGGNVTLGIARAQAPSAAVVMIFGVQESGMWSGVDLPLALDPIGAPGCGLSLGVLASFLLTADVFGDARLSFVLPSDPRLVGEWIRFQGLALDPVANPLGLVSSAGHRVQICGFEPVARVFGAGIQDLVGLREIGFAPVIRLR